MYSITIYGLMLLVSRNIIHGKEGLEDFFQPGNELYCDDDDREHNYMNLAKRSNWKPNYQIDWAVMCYGAAGEDDELPLATLEGIYTESARNLRKAAPKLEDIEFWHSQTFEATNSTEDEIIHLFQAQFIRSMAEAQLISNSVHNQGFNVSKIVAQYLIQVGDCTNTSSARCSDPIGILNRSYRNLKPKITHFEAFLQRDLRGGVEFDFFATYLVTMRNQRIFSGLKGLSFAQGEENFMQFELFRRGLFR